MPTVKVSIQNQNFDSQTEFDYLKSNSSSAGAFIQFIGCVRADVIDNKNVDGLFLEHYPGMTERALGSIITKAIKRWNLQAVSVIHRVGHLNAGDNIVYVGVASRHRQQAFESAAYIMDYLKNEVPIWKKQSLNGSESWVEQKATDKEAKIYWE